MTLVMVILFLLFWDDEGCVSSRLLCKDYTMEWRLLHEKNEICFFERVCCVDERGMIY